MNMYVRALNDAVTILTLIGPGQLTIAHFDD